jgi:serine/threonine-protein kinase
MSEPSEKNNHVTILDSPELLPEALQAALKPVQTVSDSPIEESKTSGFLGIFGGKNFRPFNDRYWIGDEIGTGGMGLVYLGLDLQLQRQVAIKVIREDRKQSKLNEHRFLREARIASRLRHPGILGIHDFSVDTSGSAYIIMDLIEGKTMEQAIRESFDQDSNRLTLITAFLQVCQAISFAHSNGVVHRDLKPANIMVGDYGMATVLDWGLAKVISSDGFLDIEANEENEGACLQAKVHEWSASSNPIANTLFGTVMGTPHYFSPEQARGQVVDYRADVFSLGGILCHILTGSPPFSGDKLVDVYQQSVSGDISYALGQLDRCGAPIPIVQLAKRCLDPNIDSRPKSAIFLVEVLRDYFESGQRRAEEELVRFFELSLDLFCIANTQGYFCRLNDNFTRALGYTTKELTSQPFIEFVHPDDRPETLSELSRLAMGEPAIQFKNRYRHRDGHYIWLEWTARAIISEGMIYAVARDISERVRFESEKIRMESERLRLSEIVDSASDAIIRKDLNGVIESWNNGAERLLGYTAEEMIGNNIHRIIPIERLDEEDWILERIRQGESIEHFETVRIHKSGELIELSVSVRPNQGPSGSINGSWKIARRITKLGEGRS